MAEPDAVPPVREGAWRPHAAMLAFVALISTSFTVGALITHAVEPVPMMFARFVMATLAMAAVMAATRTPFAVKPMAALRYLALGILVAVYFVSMFAALRLTTPVNTGAIFTLVPLLASGFAFVLLGQRVAAGQLASLVVAGTGALWVLFGGSLDRLMAAAIGRGEAIFLAGVVCYSLYTVATRWFHRGEPILVITFWSVLFGGVVLGLYGAPLIAATNWSALAPGVWLGLAHLAIMNTAVSFFLVKYATTRLPAAKVTAYTYLLPVFVAIQQGFLGLGWPTASVLAGVAVIALGTVLVQVARQGPVSAAAIR